MSVGTPWTVEVWNAETRHWEDIGEFAEMDLPRLEQALEANGYRRNAGYRVVGPF